LGIQTSSKKFGPLQRAKKSSERSRSAELRFRATLATAQTTMRANAYHAAHAAEGMQAIEVRGANREKKALRQPSRSELCST
jgi:hypothetical protein